MTTSKDNDSVSSDEVGQETVKFTLTDADHDVTNVDVDVECGGDKPKERAAWDSKVQFLLSVIGYAVGLGNVWRFPYLCQQHGGGAFLIPYFIMLFLEGIPMFYLEMAIGQKFRKGSIGVWNEIHPMLGGVGIASSVVSYIVSLYYNVIIMWCLYYLFNSFQSQLPWEHCPTVVKDNVTTLVEECEKSDATSYFWYRSTLDISSGLNETGSLNWKLSLTLLAAWVLVYLCMCKGIKSSGKVVYFTATFPYLVLIIFFGRAVTLKGADVGLKHMFTPKMERLLDPQVWLDAATQIFYSLGLAFGGLIAYASYNPAKNNVQRDAISVSITNCMTSIFASLVIFSVLGFKATNLHEQCMERNIAKLTASGLYPQYTATNMSHDTYNVIMSHPLANETTAKFSLETCNLKENLDKAAEGTGLAFIIFTQVISEFPIAPFWSIIFFLMLLTLGLGSQFGTLEGVATSLVDLDLFPWMRKKPLVAALLCISSMIIGLVFVTGAGNYWVKMFDSFGGSFPLMLVAFFEVIGVVYIYGIDRFNRDMLHMQGSKPNLYWQLTWRYISPGLMGIILVASIINTCIKPVTYLAYDASQAKNVAEAYPVWANVVIAFLVLCSSLCIPGVAILRKLGYMQYKPVRVMTISTGDPYDENDVQNFQSTNTMIVRTFETNEDDSALGSDESVRKL